MAFDFNKSLYLFFLPQQRRTIQQKASDVDLCSLHSEDERAASSSGLGHFVNNYRNYRTARRICILVLEKRFAKLQEFLGGAYCIWFARRFNLVFLSCRAGQEVVYDVLPDVPAGRKLLCILFFICVFLFTLSQRCVRKKMCENSQGQRETIFSSFLLSQLRWCSSHIFSAHFLLFARTLITFYWSPRSRNQLGQLWLTTGIR